MKLRSMQFKFLITIISAILAVAVFIGGLSIYEVDNFVQTETENFINVTCEKDASQINDVFGDMESAVHIMESYVYGLIEDYTDIANSRKQMGIMDLSEDMFIDVAKNTNGAVSYYLRFAPEVSNNTSGFFYIKTRGEENFTSSQPTDLSLYDRSDVEHVGWYWQPYEAGKPIWMKPYYNQNIDILMVSYIVPLYYNNEFFGVVGMDFDYNILIEKIHAMKIYENGFAHLEYEGEVVHNENLEVPEDSEKYLRVSRELKNGMTLVLSASYKDIEMIRYEIVFKIFLVVLLLAVLFSLIAAYVGRRIVHPLNQLTEASVKLSNGDYDVEITHSNTYEINMLSTAFEKMTQNLKEHERMQHLLAYRDSLTGLRNTNSYWAWITDFDEEIKNSEIVFGVMVLDINYLKETNDKYGHDMGNRLIVSVAHIISTVFKRSPVFRIGGDEFLVILQHRDLEDIEELIKIFDEQCMKKSVETDKEKIPVSIAKGFALYDSENDLNFIDVFNKADDAMYENKRKIKGLK